MMRSLPFSVRPFALLFLMMFSLALHAQAVRLDKVEPPNWWTGMQWSEVQLMLYGDQLSGCTARFTDERLEIRAIHSVPNTHYAFVDVFIPEGLPPDDYTLIVENNGNETRIDFPIYERERSGPRHQGFSQDDVVYLLTPDRFANGDQKNDDLPGLADFNPEEAGKRHGGDLQGIIDQLDFLADLGVTTLWLNPILENNGPNSYHGYAATDLYKIDARFGSNEDYRRLVEEAHKRGLKIIFDHVNNHIGINHAWMTDLPRPDWVNGSKADHLTDKHYLLSITDPYAAPNSEQLQKSFWFVDDMPDLNQRNPFLANYLIQNTLWWMEYTGLDGIREDTYPYPDQEFLADWVKAILTEYPNANIVGEIWALQPSYIAQFQKESHFRRDFETNLPSVMDFPLSEALRSYLRGEGRLRDVYDVLAQDFVYTAPDQLLTFIDNHDMTRAAYEAKGDTDRLKQALTILLTTRGIPQLLYATEIGMVGGESHIELRADYPGGFPGDRRSAFTEAGRTELENDIFRTTRQLLHLRKQYPALRQGRLVHYPMNWNNNVYKYLRLHESGDILVLINGDDAEKKVDLSELEPLLGNRLQLQDLLQDRQLNLSIDEGITLEKGGVRIFLLRNGR
ncbi:alpha-amylase family glycosyl hydrolase [Flavilitoribacter nigricans]|uniref:Alpha-amlyase n=1 Tax=Flavilitoribacter nigricans (strain ATCC 23147 / DSM 23189 / NBRC 102662 / NCIMB 1420 / SS-2) TaxID=1122177 RepID=A0A2D0N4N1_FLAN2|nr:alpha-amylase family glycosyl hydrolase [Flavilitoribacter nigricans]PHN03492.1 alpha-amlyase [Flavilitoribacter nigricans DSM 23189 = NBRC 102662]